MLFENTKEFFLIIIIELNWFRTISIFHNREEFVIFEFKKKRKSQIYLFYILSHPSSQSSDAMKKLVLHNPLWRVFFSEDLLTISLPYISILLGSLVAPVVYLSSLVLYCSISFTFSTRQVRSIAISHDRETIRGGVRNYLPLCYDLLHHSRRSSTCAHCACLDLLSLSPTNPFPRFIHLETQKPYFA